MYIEVMKLILHVILFSQMLEVFFVKDSMDISLACMNSNQMISRENVKI